MPVIFAFPLLYIKIGLKLLYAVQILLRLNQELLFSKVKWHQVICRHTKDLEIVAVWKQLLFPMFDVFLSHEVCVLEVLKKTYIPKF